MSTDNTASKEEKYSSDLPTKHEHASKSDTGSLSGSQLEYDYSEPTQDDENLVQSVDKDSSQEDNGAVQVEVDKEANSTTKAEYIFLSSPPEIDRCDSMAISDIDSESDMNDSRNIGDLLSSIENATKKVNEKLEKLQDSHNEEDFFASRETLTPSRHPEDNMESARRSSDTPDSVYNEATGVAGQYQQQPHQMPDVMARHPFIDANTPIMMVPSQHLLQQMHQQQMHQAQQMQMNFVPHQNLNSGLTTPMYTTTAAHPHAAAHNGNPIMVHAPAQQNSGRRTMKLRLLEEIQTVLDQNGASEGSRRSIFARVSVLARRNRTMSMGDYELDDNQEVEPDSSPQRVKTTEDRGELTISWYDGTSAVELQDHVRKSAEIKLRLGRKKLLLNLRVIDENVTPPEEIVLSPYIPDGSSFLLTFRIKDLTKKWQKHNNHRAPPSPSAAPSPPGELEQDLQRQISDVLNSKKSHRRITTSPSRLQVPDMSTPHLSNGISLEQRNGSNSPIATETQDILSQRLEKLNDTLLLLHDEGSWAKEDPNQLKTEKKEVIFVVANYFVLFLSLIAICAEIHERAPGWMAQIDLNISTVQNCATDKDALFQCVSEGNFSGLVASVVLWATQSVATKRFFLLGFDSPKKLWRVVYECCVSSFCWGFSYIFIRRGLNPDTRGDCVRKYWKDAVYGSLAGFNGAFMKAILKNFLPQADEILDVMEHRQVRLFNFLGRILKPAPGPPVTEL